MSGRLVDQAANVLGSFEPAARRVVEPFLQFGFDITSVSRRGGVGADSTFYTYFLRPSLDLGVKFGFQYEVLLAYHPFADLQNRTFEGISQFLSEAPARGRVDPLFYFLVSRDSRAATKTSAYLSTFKESRICIPVSYDELFQRGKRNPSIADILNQHFGALDRFDSTLPLREDTYFFGRNSELLALLERIRSAENVGLFGLRKTGKTSLLLRLDRQLQEHIDLRMVYFDAQSPSIRKLRWNELLEYIARRSCESLGLKYPQPTFSERTAADDFANSLDYISSQAKLSRLVVAIDEIDWIVPGSCKDPHWSSDFLEFAQALRAYQTRSKKLSLVLAGLSPNVSESASYHSYQNPFFGIMNAVYLRGLAPTELNDMLLRIGRISGMTFDDSAVKYLHAEYAGHPLLTRKACSYTYRRATADSKVWPISISAQDLRAQSEERNQDLLFYVEHLVAAIRESYPEEYAILEEVVSPDTKLYVKRLRSARQYDHLVKYGIVADAEYPYVFCRVVENYIIAERSRRLGQECAFGQVPHAERLASLKTRIQGVIQDMRELEVRIRGMQVSTLFGPNSFPEPDLLLAVRPPTSRDEFASAINRLNRSFVESIESFGKSIGKHRYFWDDVKSVFPELHDALHRVKVYRHYEDHANLNPEVIRERDRFLQIDLRGVHPDSEDRYWYLLLACLHELRRAIQIEHARLGDYQAVGVRPGSP